MRVLGQFRIVEHPGGKVPADPHDDGGAAPGSVTAEAAGQPEAEQAPSVPAQERRPGDEPPAAPADGAPTEAAPDAGTGGVDGSATAESIAGSISGSGSGPTACSGTSSGRP